MKFCILEGELTIDLKIFVSRILWALCVRRREIILWEVKKILWLNFKTDLDSSFISYYSWRKEDDPLIKPCCAPPPTKNSKPTPTKGCSRTSMKLKIRRFLLLVLLLAHWRMISSPGTPTFEVLRALFMMEECSMLKWSSPWAIPTILPPSHFSTQSLIPMCLGIISAWT